LQFPRFHVDKTASDKIFLADNKRQEHSSDELKKNTRLTQLNRSWQFWQPKTTWRYPRLFYPNNRPPNVWL